MRVYWTPLPGSTVLIAWASGLIFLSVWRVMSVEGGEINEEG